MFNKKYNLVYGTNQNFMCTMYILGILNLIKFQMAAAVYVII